MPEKLTSEQKQCLGHISSLVSRYFGDRTPENDVLGFFEPFVSSTGAVTIKTYSRTGNFKITIRRQPK